MALIVRMVFGGLGAGVGAASMATQLSRSPGDCAPDSRCDPLASIDQTSELAATIHTLLDQQCR
jgi:hypothetical protein